MADTRRPGTRIVFWLTLVVGVPTGLYGTAAAVLGQMSEKTTVTIIPQWGVFLLPLVVIGPIVAARGWNRAGSRLLVILGLALSLLPLAVNGYLYSLAPPHDWDLVYVAAGLFAACAFALMLLLSGPEPTVG